MNLHTSIAVFILGSLQLSKVCCDPNYVYKTTNIECIANDTFVANTSCVIKARNWNNAVAQMDCDLVLPMRNSSIRLQVFKRGYNNGYHPFLVNVLTNMCDVMSKRNYLPYGIMMMKVLKQFTNFNHSCPITGHLMARNLYLQEFIFPKLPFGFYFLNITFLENLDQFGTTGWIGTVKFYFEAKEVFKSKRKPKT